MRKRSPAIAADPTPAILAAAKACYLRVGIEKTGMEDIARAAGLARSTLYRYFPSHEQLLLSVITAEVQIMNEQMRNMLANHAGPADTVIEGLILALRWIPQHPLLSRVFVRDEGGMLRSTLWSSPELVQLGLRLMQTLVDEATRGRQLQSAVAPEVRVEWVYRILLSFLSLPSNWIKTDEDLRRTFRALLIPVLLKTDAATQA